MLRKAIELIRRAGLRAYHGSDEPDIEELAAYKPNLQYGGDIGAGVYVSENYDTAASYGRYVYVLDLALDWGDIFDLSAENQYIVEGYEGESVLIGESIPPFYFLVGKDKYLVSNTESDIGASLRAKEMLIESLEEAGLDILIPMVRGHDGLPDIDDIEWGLTDLESDLDESQIEAADKALLDQVAPLLAAAEAWFAANEATVIDLEDIGAEVEAAGYKALYFERGGTIGDEILVFDPNNVRIVEQVTKMAKLRIEAKAYKDYMDMLDAAAEFLNGEYTPVGTEDSAPGVAWMVIYSGPYAGKVFMVWDDSLYNESVAARAKKLNMVYFAPTSLGISIMEVPDIGTDTTDEQMALWDKHWPGWYHA